jgi:hypothetical protein
MPNPNSESTNPALGRDRKQGPDVFLSSTLSGLKKIRSTLADWFEQRGYYAFVFERFKDRATWNTTLPAECEAICLDHVSCSKLYIGIFRSDYGTSANAHVADIAFTDLELFEAFRVGVPMRLYLLEDSKTDPRLTALCEGRPKSAAGGS